MYSRLFQIRPAEPIVISREKQGVRPLNAFRKRKPPFAAWLAKEKSIRGRPA
jgi:hypothetical protein